MGDNRITVSLHWREDGREQFEKGYKTYFGDMSGFVYRQATGGYLAQLFDTNASEDGARFAGYFTDAEIAKKWLDVVIAEWGRLVEMEDYQIEKEWMEKVRESS